MAATVTAVQNIDWDVPEQVGLWSDAWRRFRRNHLAVAGAVVVIFLVLIALCAPLLVQLGWIRDPITQDVAHTFAPPGGQFVLGTDDLGRDVLSRLIFGTRVSLMVGVVVQVIILVIGGTIGVVSGYAGGRIDNLLMRFTDVWYAFPDLIFVIVLVSVFGASLWSIFIAIGIVSWVNLARLVRGQVLSIKEKEFVEAARATGSSPSKIILRHLIPNSLGPVIVQITFGIPQAIIVAAVLAYLGLGIPPPQPTWGGMVNDGTQAIFSDPSVALLPALVLAITTLAFTFVGDGLRDALDPRMRR